jgi:hypothetical protein
LLALAQSYQSINQPSTLLLKPLEDDELKWQICRS